MNIFNTLQIMIIFLCYLTNKKKSIIMINFYINKQKEKKKTIKIDNQIKF